MGEDEEGGTMGTPTPVVAMGRVVGFLWASDTAIPHTHIKKVTYFPTPFYFEG